MFHPVIIVQVQRPKVTKPMDVVVWMAFKLGSRAAAPTGEQLQKDVSHKGANQRWQ